MVKVPKIRLNVTLLAKVVAVLTVVIVYCEFLHYYIVLYQCSWPTLDTKNSKPNGTDETKPLHAMVVADTHLLGSRNGHWFDKLRREWQMHRTYQTAVELHSPNIVIFLGDLFDEGKWCHPQEFAEYVFRFHDLFPTPKDGVFFIAAGNHDIGFHYSVNPYLINRFQEAFATGPVELEQIQGVTFIIINSMAMEGDNCFLCKPAMDKIKIISKQLKCASGDSEACKYWKSPKLLQHSQPIILQHYPLFRESDALCNEPDEAPEEIKFARFRERWECISKDSTETLLEQLSPRLVLSGHTHHGCHMEHSINEGPPVQEYTIPSFSWRNKQNPTFSMLTANPTNYSIYKCHMPNEQTIIAIYVLASISVIAWLLMKKFKSQGILYVKVRGHTD